MLKRIMSFELQKNDVTQENQRVGSDVQHHVNGDIQVDAVSVTLQTKA